MMMVNNIMEVGLMIKCMVMASSNGQEVNLIRVITREI